MVVAGISAIAPIGKSVMSQQPETPIVRNRAGGCSDQDLKRSTPNPFPFYDSNNSGGCARAGSCAQIEDRDQ